MQNALWSFPSKLNDWWILQGERKLSVLVGYSIIFMLHVIGVYWWYQNDDLSYPLFMVPPKAIPPFWHAIFIIIINGMKTIWLLLFYWRVYGVAQMAPCCYLFHSIKHWVFWYMTLNTSQDSSSNIIVKKYLLTQPLNSFSPSPT